MSLSGDAMHRFELAERLKGFIRRSGKTQAQLADELGVDKTYMSQLATGKVNWVNSSYFGALAGALGLSEHEVRELNPAAVVNILPSEDVSSAPFDPRTLFHPPAQRERVKRDLSPNLSQMIEEKQEKYPQLRETRWQQHLNQTRFANGQEPDADGWFEMYQALRRNNVEPEPWPDD